MPGYESLYEGSPSYLTPKEDALKYISAGYQSPLGALGIATDPRTANQLSELNIKLNPGAKHMEVGAIQGAVMESIPEQHLDEMRRQAKLAGVSLSLHAPIVEPSGMGERDWSEVNRIGAERQLESALLRAHKLNPTGNISVTTHSAAGPELIEKHMEKNPETGKIEEKTTAIYVVDPDSGRISTYPVQKKFFPEEGEYKPGQPRKFDIKDELKKINEEQWTSSLSEINRLATYGEERLDAIGKEIPKEVFSKLLKSPSEGGIDVNDFAPEDRDIFKNAQREIVHSQIYLRDAYRGLKDIFDKAYLSGSEEDKKKLDEFANEVKDSIKPGIETNPAVLGEVLEKGIKVLGDIKTPPERWKPLQDFAMDKSAETFANVAASAYKKFGDTAPILNIENPPAGGGFSRAEDLKELIEKTRGKLADNLKNEGLSSGEAKKQAEKLVGATWDVGHINMLRKKGYSEEDVIKQSAIIAPFVHHVHLSDNFGMDHTELPMGMGNVPMQKIMEKLGEKGFEAKKIIEAGNWWQYFAEKGGGNPFKPSIEAFNSPVYAMAGGPYWSQLGGYGMYYSGHGPINPAVHHKLYGSGFEALPVELGGEIPGDKGRFSGTPNQ